MSLKSVTLLFPGQGSQYIGMGKQLYATQPTFRKIIDHCDEILRNYLEQPLLEILYQEFGHFSSSIVIKMCEINEILRLKLRHIALLKVNKSKTP